MSLNLRPQQVARTCPRCGSVHDESKSWCKPCEREYMAAYRVANKDRLLAARRSHYEANKQAYKDQARAWKAAHPDVMRELSRRYYAKNREQEQRRLAEWEQRNQERRREAKKQWRIDNHAKLAAQCRARQARKLCATPKWADRALIEVEYALAMWCSKVMGEPYHVDHIIPLQGELVCGLHVHNNLQVIPQVANLSKGNRHG